MILLLAVEAEGVATLAGGDETVEIIRSFKDIVAAFHGAPFHVFVLICHLLAVPAQVFL